jgi:hypothetical protein
MDQPIAIPHVIPGSNSVSIPNAQSLDKGFLIVILDVLCEVDVFSVINMLYAVDWHKGTTYLGKGMFLARPARISGPIYA